MKKTYCGFQFSFREKCQKQNIKKKPDFKFIPS